MMGIIFFLRTSLFIVGSSTYAQLLIVICIVSALSEVVTHNVPFLFFEVRTFPFHFVPISLYFAGTDRPLSVNLIWIDVIGLE